MELLRHVDDTSPPSESTTGATSSGSFSIFHAQSSRSTWHTNDHCTMALISQSCEIDIRMEIGHLGTAREMWHHLRHMFEQSSEAREYAVVRDISHIHQRDHSVRGYITKMRSL